MSVMIRKHKLETL